MHLLGWCAYSDIGRRYAQHDGQRAIQMIARYLQCHALVRASPPSLVYYGCHYLLAIDSGVSHIATSFAHVATLAWLLRTGVDGLAFAALKNCLTLRSR